MESKIAHYVMTFRSNDGEDHAVEVAGLDDAKKRAKNYRTNENYMVCVMEDGNRILRWDRDGMIGSNRWRAVDPNEFETLGPLRAVTRTAIR